MPQGFFKVTLFVLLLLFAGLFMPHKASAQVTTYAYIDSLQSGWSVNPWDGNQTINLSNTNPVYAGTYSFRYSPARSWGGVELNFNSTLDGGDYSYLHLAARATTNNSSIKIKLKGGSSEVWLHDYTPIPSANWQVYQIPLTDLGATCAISGIVFQNGQNYPSSFYFDEIGFGGPPPPIPTPEPPKNVQLSVNAANQIHPFSNELLGVALVNWEHSWNKAFAGDVPQLANALKAANVGLIRYAGGLWANYVGWERLPQRTPYGNYTPNPANYDLSGVLPLVYNHHYGTNEIDSLAKLSYESGAEVMIQVNITANNPVMWADMVKYVKDKRAQNIPGHNYYFKYWELGNELDLECWSGSAACVQPDEYKNRVESYSAAMKAQDSTIKIVAGVPASAHDGPRLNYSDNVTDMSLFLHRAAETNTQVVDSLSWHRYQTNNSGTDIQSIKNWGWDTVPYDSWRNQYSRNWSFIAPERIENEIIEANNTSLTQGITELNIDANDFGCAPQNSNHLNSLWQTEQIGRFAYNGLDYATWYTGYGNAIQGYPAIFVENDYTYGGGGSVNGGPMYIRPSYYGLFMYGNYFGDMLVESTSNSEVDIAIWASTDSTDPGKLKLMVTNISGSDITSTINLQGFSAQSAQKYQYENISGNPINMYGQSNSPEHGSVINGYTLEPNNILNAVNEIVPEVIPVNGSSLTHLFPRYTTTALILSTDSAPSPTPTLPGDANGDGLVNIQDYVLLSNQFGQTGTLSADFNNDQVVNIQDYVILSNNFGN